MDAKLLAQWSINAVTIIFIIYQVRRSIVLRKGFSSETIKMYLVVFSMFVISNLAIADILPFSVITNALFAVLGFMCGNKFMPSETKKETKVE